MTIINFIPMTTIEPVKASGTGKSKLQFDSDNYSLCNTHTLHQSENKSGFKSLSKLSISKSGTS